MSQINCYIPIKLRITGRPSDSQLNQLGDALVRALTARLDFAERVIEDRYGAAFGDDYQLVREAYDPEREAGATSNYLVPSYGKRGDKEPIKRLQRAPSGPSWVFQSPTAGFQARVGDFISFRKSLSKRSTDDGYGDLYFDQLEEIRSVVVWGVKVNHDQLLRKDLVPQLDERARKLSKTNQRVISVGLVSRSASQQMIEIAKRKRVSAKLPDLNVNRDKKLVRWADQNYDFQLLPGALVLFAWMNLPEINLTDRVTLNPWSDIKVPWREVEIIQTDFQEAFQQKFGAPWESFKQEFGHELTTLRLAPFVVRSRTPFQTLKYLIKREFGSLAETSIPLGDLHLLRQGFLDGLNGAKSKVDPFSNEATRNLNEDSRLNHWEAGWAGAYFHVVDKPTDGQLAGARHLPDARLRAAALRKLLSSDPTKLVWSDMALAFLSKHYGSNPGEESRPLDGGPFEYLLEEMDKDTAFERLFDLVERFGREDLQKLLARLALATYFADMDPVRSWLDRLGSRAEGKLRHTYRENEILLHHKTAVRVGQVFGDVREIRETFIFQRKDRWLKPSRAAAFWDAYEIKQKELMGKVARREDANEYTKQQFATAVLSEAAKHIKLKDEDFEEITIQSSIRLLRIEKRKTLPRFYITYEIVERPVGGTWQSASNPIEKSVEDFEGVLLLWILGRAGELFQAVATPILVAGVVIIAWEAGIIAALIKMAGGWAAVGVSISISELILILRCISGNAKLTLETVMDAALEGYLNALGFKLAGGAVKLVATKIGTAALKMVITQRLLSGIVGGAGSAAMLEFTHNLFDVVIESDGKWSDSAVYWEKMKWGAVFGALFEVGSFGGSLFLKAIAKKELETLSQVVALASREGFTSVRWTAVMTDALGILCGKVKKFFSDAAEESFRLAMRKRVLQVAKQLPAEYRLEVFRNVLETAPQGMSSSAVKGLEKFLDAFPAKQSDKALAFFNKLKLKLELEPNRLNKFLENLNRMGQSSVNRIINDRLAVYLRALELSPEGMSRSAVQGLEKFIGRSLDDLSSDTALYILNKLNPSQLRNFLETLNMLDQSALSLALSPRLAVFLRAMEHAPERMSSSAVEGLKKFIGVSRADLSNEAALSLLNKLQPSQLPDFLEALNRLDRRSLGNALHSRQEVFRCVVELAPKGMAPSAVQGLEKFIGASYRNVSDEAALSILNKLSPDQLPKFLETLNGLEELYIEHVFTLLSKSNASQAQKMIPLFLEGESSRKSLISFLELVWERREQIIKSDFMEVYRLYYRPSNPGANPLRRSAEEFLEAVHKLLIGRPIGAKSQLQSPHLGEAQTFHHFIRYGAKTEAGVEHIYLNVKADNAPEVMEFVVRELVDNHGQFPGITEAKVAGSGLVSGRVENLVIYAENEAAMQKALERILKYQADHPDHFLKSTPYMTKRISDGVGVGMAPYGSFGVTRSQFIYGRLKKWMKEKGKDLTLEEFQRHTLEYFEKEGVYLGAPHTSVPVTKPISRGNVEVGGNSGAQAAQSSLPGSSGAEIPRVILNLRPGEALLPTQSAKATQLRMTGSSGAKEPLVILYRGTTYQFIHGGSKNLHDLGDGLYLTFEPGLALRYAQEHRVKVNVDTPGDPGIALRVETTHEEFGRVLDFYNNKVLKDDWEAYLEIFESGRDLKKGLGNENYSRFFGTWLKNKGMDASQFDAIVGPEYVRGGSQICVRNKAIAERLIAKAEEWARVHEPLGPASPDPDLPIDKKLLDLLKK